MLVVARVFTTETQRGRREDGVRQVSKVVAAFMHLPSSVSPLCTLCLCGEGVRARRGAHNSHRYTRRVISADIHAIETISRNCFRSFARFPAAELIDDGRVYGVMSHVPISFFSGIATTHLDANDIDREVESVIEMFRARQCPFRWWLTPSTQPEGLAAVLAAHGMRHAYDAPGM